MRIIKQSTLIRFADLHPRAKPALRYENQRWPFDSSAVDSIDLLNCLIEDGGRSQAELLGSRSRASGGLNGKRALIVDMIHKLHTDGQVPAELLIAPHRLAAA